MRSYFIKYGLLFLLTVLLIDAVLFFTSNNKKDIDMSSLIILGQAIDAPLEKGDISRVNNIIDTYGEKVIIEREGVIYTSNFGKNQQDRTSMATEQIENYRSFWQPLIISSASSSETIYYKIRDINYTNKILMNTLFSFLLGLCTLPLIFFMFRDIDSLYDSIEHLKQYLVATREHLEEIKNTKISNEFDISNEKEKLHKKLAESKNKRLALQKDLDKYKYDLEKRNEDVHSLRETINTLKSDIQNNKVDKNRLEEAKNIAVKEKQDAVKKALQLENEIKAKEEEISSNNFRIKELNNVIEEVRKHLKQREMDLQKLKVSKVDPSEYELMNSKNAEIQKELSTKVSEIRDLIAQLESKNVNIDNLKDNIAQLNLERLKLQNEIGSLKVKINADRELIDGLVKEGNLFKDKIHNLEDKIKDEEGLFGGHRTDAYLDAEQKRLSILLRDKENQIKQLLEDNKQKDDEVKEFTLDTLEKLSALKRFETQIVDMSKELLQKDNAIESLNTRLDIKDKIIDTLNRELNDVKDKINNFTHDLKTTGSGI